MRLEALFNAIGLQAPTFAQAGNLPITSPIDGCLLGNLAETQPAGIEQILVRAQSAFEIWREVPAPQRGELIRLFGEELRARKDALAGLVTLDCGKIVSEARGEVQEMIDICDFAVGLSRQLYGLTIASERPGHHMLENWRPLGPVAVISAFNFPVAVWAWNLAIAIVCGNPVVWKPSEKTLLCAIAANGLFERACERFGSAPDGLAGLVLGGPAAGATLAGDRRIPLVSATGSTGMGRSVAAAAATRFGRTILELGGNNAAIVTPSANVELACRAMVFAAAGTAGQRCTSLRRAFIHESIYEDVRDRLASAYASLPVGDPTSDQTLVGPLIDRSAFDAMEGALAAARSEGGVSYGGERLMTEVFPNAFYVRPAIVEMAGQLAFMHAETFAPILYLCPYRDLDQAIGWQNEVPQGLSSCIFTNDLREAERFTSASGSDCGIANVNIGPSGAEIGGAFGGEKETGGGRESGSDAWKAYMRRQTTTINYSDELPLAQGVRFEVG
jgi:aldehyde dehydrogenase (NAD+)